MATSVLRKLTAVCLISSLVPSTMALTAAVDAAEVMGLFTRQSDVCANIGTNFTACGQGLPANFCCGPSTTCIPFNNGASAICCPVGQNCQTIEPIPCNQDNLNATLNPTAPLHSTDTTDTLPSCGGTCCPAGATCQNNNCILNLSPSSSSTASPSSTAKATSTSSILSVNPTSTNAAAIGTSPSNVQCNPFPALAIIIGFFPGMIAGALLTVLVIICYGHRRDSKRKSADFGPVAANVSDPIYHDTGATRTDFLRRGSGAKKATISTPTRTSSRVRSLFSRGSTAGKHGQRLGSDGAGSAQMNELNMAAYPRTPENRTQPGLRKEPSMESITIYSPPDARLGGSGGSRATTFSEMMNRAAGQHIKEESYPSYMGSPGRVDPRSRGVGNGVLR